MRNYPLDTLEDARDSRNRAWADHMAGRISTVELFRVTTEARRLYGERIYER